MVDSPTHETSEPTTEELLREEIRCLKGYIGDQTFPPFTSQDFTAVSVLHTGTSRSTFILVRGVSGHKELRESQHS